MTVKIITDSLGDLPVEIINKLDIGIIPLHVLFGSESYRDGIDISSQQFYSRLVSSSVLPTTSVPSIGEIIEMFEKYAGQTHEILMITVTHKLSGTYETALKAAEILKTRVRIKVIDSLNIIMGQGLLVIKAAEMAKNNAGLDEIIKSVQNNIARIESRMAFDTLEYLRRGGRIGAGQAFLGSILKINPVLGLRDGEVYPLSRERSRIKAIDSLYHWIMSYKKIEAIAVEDATTPDEADRLVERIKQKYDNPVLYRSKVGAVIGAHSGPNVIAVSVLGDK
jgi:DegV family protein with EDD domain